MPVHGVLTSPPSQPGNRSGTGLPGGWVRDYLRDPAGTLDELADWLGRLLPVWGPAVGVALAMGAAVLAGARWGWRRRCQVRLGSGARVVTVLAPPTVDPAGGQLLWANLVGLLRPAWARWWSGQPHLGWEVVFSEAGVRIQVWVPGPVPPGLVERAVAAAWPGAHTHTHPAQPPLPTPEHSRRRRVVIGGQLRLARPEPLPIRTSFDADPLRALLGAAGGLGPGEHACVQILARPVTGHRLARARRTARRLHTGAPPHHVGWVLDLLTPGPARAPRMQQRHPQGGEDPQITLEHSAQNRAIVGKARGARYETVARYTRSPAPTRQTPRACSRSGTRPGAGRTRWPRRSLPIPSTTTTPATGCATPPVF